MAGDWRDIPGIRYVLKRLSAVMASGGMIAFVGAWSDSHLSSATGGYAIWRGAGSVSRFRDELFRPPAREPPVTEALKAELARRIAAKQVLVVVGTGAPVGPWFFSLLARSS